MKQAPSKYDAVKAPASEAITETKRLPGPPFVISGTVVSGARLGKTVGMPTANLSVPENTLLPGRGVYATAVTLAGTRFYGVTNIGKKPSVKNDDAVTIETFIFDFSGDIYGEPLTVEFYKFLRPEKKFGSLQEVKNQVDEDCARARAYFEEFHETEKETE